MDALRVPRSVEEVFGDFKGRRAGLIKALTTGIYIYMRINVCLLFLANLVSFVKLTDLLFMYISCIYVFLLCDLLQICKSFTRSVILVSYLSRMTILIYGFLDKLLSVICMEVWLFVLDIYGGQRVDIIK